MTTIRSEASTVSAVGAVRMKNLPAEAQEILKILEAEDDMAAGQQLQREAKLDRAREELSDLYAALAHMERQRGVPKWGAKDEKKIENLKTEIDAARKRISQIQSSAPKSPHLLSDVAEYLATHSGPFKYRAPTIKIADGADHAALLVANRSAVKDFNNEIGLARHAPLPFGEAKARMIAEVDRLAAHTLNVRQFFNVDVSIRTDRVSPSWIEWPAVYVKDDVVDSKVYALIAAACREQVIAFFESKMKSVDVSGALTIEERLARVAECVAQYGNKRARDAVRSVVQGARSIAECPPDTWPALIEALTTGMSEDEAVESIKQSDLIGDDGNVDVAATYARWNSAAKRVES